MKEIIKTLDKNNEKLKLSTIAKKQKLKERGITLIALVVTIIILLILAGVTLNIALSDNGLFSKTKKAAEDYKEAQSEEEDLISQFATQMYSEYVGATVTGYTPDKKTYTIEKEKSGADENQTFTTDDDMTWKVWDFDGNTLRIIGNPTNQKLTLKGAAGYNNGVYLINEICRKCYGQYENGTENMKSGISVANLRRSDIQKVSSYDYTNYVFVKGDWRKKFGETTTYEENVTYPTMWEKDREWAYSLNSDRDKECLMLEKENGKNNGSETKTVEGDENVFKQSYYCCSYNNAIEEFENARYVDLIFNIYEPDNSSCEYWLSGRNINLANDAGIFGICCVYASGLSFREYSGTALYTTNGIDVTKTQHLRPIVSINLSESGIKIDTEVDSDGKMTINLK